MSLTTWGFMTKQWVWVKQANKLGGGVNEMKSGVPCKYILRFSSAWEITDNCFSGFSKNSFILGSPSNTIIWDKYVLVNGPTFFRLCCNNLRDSNKNGCAPQNQVHTDTVWGLDCPAQSTDLNPTDTFGRIQSAYWEQASSSNISAWPRKCSLSGAGTNCHTHSPKS